MNTERWLIWSIEHSAWWGPNSHGYVKLVCQAGRYGFEEAKQIVADANQHNLTGAKSPMEVLVPAPEGTRITEVI